MAAQNRCLRQLEYNLRQKKNIKMYYTEKYVFLLYAHNIWLWLL